MARGVIGASLFSLPTVESNDMLAKQEETICMNCYARNAPRATRCRKCHSKELRPKAKEARKE